MEAGATTVRYSITINGQEHTLELARGNGLSCRLDGEPFEAEVAEIAPGVYSILLGGKSFQARVAATPAVTADGAGGVSSYYSVQIDGTTYSIVIRDPRRRSRERGGAVGEGKQNINAPMPGKVIRILVSENQRVEASQGLVVVGAMKMQNEIKSPKSGSVVKVLVREGQAVNAGETLLVVE
jgi:biotin carboxyl carrier protein